MKNYIKKHLKKIALSFTAATAIFALTGCASNERTFKSLSSDFGGGLYRTVTVYDYNGHKLEQFTGKIDVQESDGGNKVLFDLEGKRHVFYNAIVTVDEK